MTATRPDPWKTEHAQVDLMRGQFASAWSRLEMRLRSLELMHTGKHHFEPVDLKSVEVKSPRRFRERVQHVIPPGEVRDWLLRTQKIRNVVLHGVLIGLDGAPVLAHADFQASLEAGRGRSAARHLANVTMPQSRPFPRPKPGGDVVNILKLQPSIVKAHEVADFLSKTVDEAHEYGEVRLTSSPDGASLVSQHRTKR